jgi:hypothetical protein
VQPSSTWNKFCALLQGNPPIPKAKLAAKHAGESIKGELQARLQLETQRIDGEIEQLLSVGGGNESLIVERREQRAKVESATHEAIAEVDQLVADAIRRYVAARGPRRKRRS